MKYVALVCITLMLCWPVQAQQIAWSPTLRKPYAAPTTFVGMEASAGYTWHNAQLPYLEDVYNIPCCTYETGASVPRALGITVESWLLPTVALSAAIGVRMESAAFSTSPLVVPRNGHADVVTQYQLDANISWLSLGGGAKFRISATPISVGLSLAGNILMSSELSHKEIVVGPEDYYFLTDPPTKEMSLPVSSFSDISGLVVRPAVSLSYDIPLTDGYYLAPSVRCEATLGSISQRHSWGTLGVSFAIALYRGL